MDKPTVKILTEQYNIKEIVDFTDMDDDERKKVLKGKDIDKIAEGCNRYPAVSLEYSLGEKDGDEVELAVKLERDEELENDLVISNYFPA